jgi:hypothetical protein
MSTRIRLLLLLTVLGFLAPNAMVVGLCFAVPLYLLLRERALDTAAG